MNKICLLGAAALIVGRFPSRRGFCPARWWRNARRWDGRLSRRRDGRRFSAAVAWVAVSAGAQSAVAFGERR